MKEPIVDGSWKGLPPLLSPTRISQVGTLGWSLLDDTLPTPVAVLRDEALDHNREWMRRFLARTGAGLAPHAKTTMSPELFALQVADGAWGLTVATVHQAAVALEAGVRRLILANEVVTRPELDWIAAVSRQPGVEILPLVDSPEAVERLAALGVPLGVLLEIGYPGGRCGCRTAEAALGVARAVAAAPTLRLAGIEAYEGLVAGEDREGRVATFLDTVVDVAAACRAGGLLGDAPLLTAGGTSFPDMVAGRFAPLAEFQTVLRSGCYLTGDHGLYAAATERLAERAPDLAGDGLLPALEVWAAVVSRPEPGRVILGAGKRDVGVDAGPPVPLRAARAGEGTLMTGGGTPGSPSRWARGVASQGGAPLDARVVEVNDQHAHLVVAPESPLRVGDRVALGITHPCTTFDRWSVLLRVDAGWRVTGAVHTRFG